MKRLRSWWRAVTKRGSLERDMEAELRFHIDAYAADLTASGINEDEAMRKAQIAFGNVEACKDSARESVGLRLWDELRNDLRYTMRALRNSPGFANIAILSLALGIGANTTIFSLAKAVLLDKLAVPNPDELRLFSWWQAKESNAVVHELWGSSNIVEGGRESSTSFSYPVYRLLRQGNPDFAQVFAFKQLGGYNGLTATIDGAAEMVTGEMVSGNYYSGLRVTTALGRPIGNADDRESSPIVAVISDAFWARRFGRSRDVIGKQIELNLAPVTIVGVNPPGFTGANSVQVAPDVFLPLSSQPIVLPRGKSLLSDTDLWWVLVMGRLKPGLQPRAESAFQLRLDKAVRATMSITPGESLPHAELLPGNRGLNSIAQKGTEIKVLLALVGFVLLLACSNIANLMLARAAARRREFSMRLALGASRARLVRQLLTESVTLALLGGAAGLAIGYYARNVIPHFVNSSWERPQVTADFDAGVLLFTVAISLCTGLLFGVAPAWSAVRRDLYTRARDRGLRVSQGAKNRAGQALVILQVSLSLLLVAAAGMFVQTLTNVQRQKLGFDPNHLLLFDIRPPQARYAGLPGQQLLHKIEERLRFIPGVVSVGLSEEPLIANSMSNGLFYHPGEKRARNGNHMSYYNLVNPDFFSTMRIPLLAGRTFTSHNETDKEDAMVVNQAFVRKFFPNANALGKTLDMPPDRSMRIVGVCADAKYFDAKSDMPPTAYLFHMQATDADGATFEIRTNLGAAQLAAPLRNAVHSIDKDLPVIDLRTQLEQIGATRMDERLFASLASGFAFLALAIASIGVYGLMAFSVASRTNEIGIRMALGAHARQVLRMVLRETSLLAVGGVLLGLGGAIALMRVIRSMLFGLQPGDPVTLGGATLLLLIVASAAAYIPARRAAKIDPMQALRHE